METDEEYTRNMMGHAWIDALHAENIEQARLLGIAGEEIAALKATLDLSAKANNALALKIGRLVEAGDGMCRCPKSNGCDDCNAWTAAKEWK